MVVVVVSPLEVVPDPPVEVVLVGGALVRVKGRGDWVDAVGVLVQHDAAGGVGGQHEEEGGDQEQVTSDGGWNVGGGGRG